PTKTRSRPTNSHSCSTPIVLAKPQPSDGTHGTASRVFVGQIGLHAITYPKHFPTNASKVVFAVFFREDYAATCSQPYLDKVFNGEPVVFNNFLNDFRSSFFDHNRRNHAEVALQNLRQTGTVSAYTQNINQHTRTVGWADSLLMSLYPHSLKENIQLAVVMSKIEFDSLQSMQAMALKVGQTIEGIRCGDFIGEGTEEASFW
ncbi:uncharacterized protein VP01_8256g1, partial [Puccinia sorghi]